MNEQDFLKEDEYYVPAGCEKISYSGRIDFSDTNAPVFVFPGSSAYMLFTGASLKVLIKNNHGYLDNYLGYIIDGMQKKVLLSNDNMIHEIVLADDMEENKKHEVIIFKRQDACHEFTFYGFIMSKRSILHEPYKKPRRCMEFYGDSITAGELSEAVNYTGKSDPVHNGEYSNAWYSYAMMTARNLKAQVNIVAQSGISLMDHIGYFHGPDYIGMESVYDKLHFNPDLGKVTNWNFKGYTPHVVVIALGQNDSAQEGFMKKEQYGEKADIWKQHYKQFVLNIRSKYSGAFIVLTTTILNHHPAWDRAIGSICRDIDDDKIVHFLYSYNGRGTPGHVRIPEAEQMAFELSIFLKGFGNEIWED